MQVDTGILVYRQKLTREYWRPVRDAEASLRRWRSPVVQRDATSGTSYATSHGQCILKTCERHVLSVNPQPDDQHGQSLSRAQPNMSKESYRLLMPQGSAQNLDELNRTGISKLQNFKSTFSQSHCEEMEIWSRCMSKGKACILKTSAIAKGPSRQTTTLVAESYWPHNDVAMHPPVACIWTCHIRGRAFKCPLHL